MLRARIVTAIFLLAGLLGALFFLPDIGWVALCALICAAAAWEWGNLAGWGKKARIAYGFFLGGGCFVLDHVLRMAATHAPELDRFPRPILPIMEAGFMLDWLVVAFWLLIVPFWLRYKWPLRDWSAASIGVVVLVPPTLFFMAERVSPPVLLASCAIVWVADIAAYFSGRAFGGRKLAPSISPGKTWAGAIGAVIGVSLYCNLIVFWGRPLPPLQWMPLFQLAFVGLAAVSIVGDLFESLLKRQAGVKDSGHLLPGHGGILDRIDSLASTLPSLAVLSGVFRDFPLI